MTNSTCSLIVGVRIENRDKSAVEVQKVLTEYGCYIRSRLGLHDQEPSGVCSPGGVLLLQLCSNDKEAKKLEKALDTIDGVKAKLIDLR